MVLRIVNEVLVYILFFKLLLFPEALANYRLVSNFKFFNCGSGPEKGHETALELVSGANFG